MNQDFVNDFLADYNDTGIQNVLMVSIAIFVAAGLLHLLSFYILRKVNGKKNRMLVKNLHDKFKIPTLLFLQILAFDIVLIAFAPNGSPKFYLQRITNLFIIFIVSWVLVRFIQFGRDVILRKYDIQQKDNLKARRVYTQFKIIERILVFVVVVIALATALMTFESIRKIGVSLFASAGVAGIILGFAAQRMIGTVVAGIQIAITQPIRLEDAVVVEKEWGWIEEINLTYVVIRIWDLRRLVLPTTYFIETPFQNWTRNSADIMGTVFLYTDYSVPFDKLREELTRVLGTTELWDGKVNVLQVTDSTEKAIEIRVLVSAIDSPTAWDLRVYVREKLIEYLQKNYPESLPRARVMLENS